MKLTVTVWIMMCCLVSNNLIGADLTEVEICTLSGNQTAPDIDADVVVWQDADGNLYRKRFADPNDPNVIAAAGEQTNPAVSDDVVVWYDVHTSGGTQKEIYGHNLTTGIDLFLTFNDGKTQKNPAICGDTVVWQDLTNGNYDIKMYNLATDTSEFICTDTAHQYDPAVSTGYAVWKDSRDDGYAGNDIYMCDLTAGTPYANLAVSPSDAEQWYPAASGDLIAWEEIEGGLVTIVVYDVAGGRRIWEHTIDLYINPRCDVYHDPVGGDKFVVWQQAGEGDSDIMGCDLNTGIIFDVATSSYDDQLPAVSGRRIVWQRNGADIYGAVIPSPTVISVDAPVAGQMVLAGSEMEINWTLDSGEELDFVDIAYSVNDGLDQYVIAEDVPFADYTYTWSEVVDANSVECRVYLTEAEGASTIAQSELFTIFRCDPALTADITGDCFVDMADFAQLAAQWLRCGNLYDSQWCAE
ncbi:MAG: hypothetical protein ACYTET_07765 [Planctomycetota bacterium]